MRNNGMTDIIIPSTGEVRSGPFLNLNAKGYKAGDRVLFEVPFGNPAIDTIDLFAPDNPNMAVIDGRRILVVEIKGRVPAGTAPETEQALIEALRDAYAEQPHIYGERRKRIMREHGVR